MSTRDINRKPVDFHTPVVEGVLPSHFLSQYPKFVALLKHFYAQTLEQTHEDDGGVNNVFYAKDREAAPESYLDYLFHEAINGLGADKLIEPRLTLKLVPSYYPIKGTTTSVPAFFRYIYGVDASQFYPKTQIFTLGESELGSESLRFLTDSYFYQILSIQIKSPLGIADWRDIYKRFNHAAGFALFAETLFETTAGELLTPVTQAEAEAIPTELASTLFLSFDDEESSFVET